MPLTESSGDADRWRDLADRVRQGDSSAEEELSAHFRPRILAMAVVRLRDVEAARDIAQEALLAVLLALREGKLREPEKLPAFVSGTTRNLVNNLFRSLREQPNLVVLSPEIPSAINVATEAELTERRQFVRHALEIDRHQGMRLGKPLEFFKTRMRISQKITD